MNNQEILFILFSYLIGSIPFGYLIFFVTEKKDIRTLGSRSTGATNVLRNKGKAAGLITLLLDILKGAIPIWYGRSHFDSPVLILIGGAAVVAGHVFPLFLKFRGGKGVGPFLGIFLVFHFPSLLTFLGVWLITVITTRFVSLGSILGCTALFFSVLFTQIPEVSLVALFIVILIITKHLGNIRRLLSGSEPKLDLSKKDHA